MRPGLPLLLALVGLPTGGDAALRQDLAAAPVDAGALLDFPGQLVAQLAIAGALAAEGRIEEAGSRLLRSDDERARREADRLGELDRWRRDAVRRAVGTGVVLRAVWDTGPLESTVQSVSDTGFVLGPDAASALERPWSALDTGRLLELARTEGSPFALAGGPRAHLAWILGEDDWATEVLANPREAASLAADHAVLERARRERDVARAFVRLSRHPLSAEAAEASRAIADLDELLTRFRDHPWVTEHRTRLEAFARGWLEEIVAERAWPSLLPHATVTPEAKRSVVDYRFDDRAVLEDFDGVLETMSWDESGLLLGEGAQLRIPVLLEAPWEIRFSVRANRTSAARGGLTLVLVDPEHDGEPTLLPFADPPGDPPTGTSEFLVRHDGQRITGQWRTATARSSQPPATDESSAPDPARARAVLRANGGSTRFAIGAIQITAPIGLPAQMLLRQDPVERWVRARFHGVD